MASQLTYQAIVEPTAALYNISPSWVYAVIGTESGDLATFTFNEPAATWEPARGEFAWGPMQILESTARDMGFSGSAAQLNDPAVSIPLGITYMAWLRNNRGATTFPDLYSAYNSGDPSAWRSPGQVQQNVQRALTWLAHFRPKGIGAAVVIVVVGLGYVLSHRHK